jgi:hypothetical protein
LFLPVALLLLLLKLQSQGQVSIYHLLMWCIGVLFVHHAARATPLGPVRRGWAAVLVLSIGRAQETGCAAHDPEISRKELRTLAVHIHQRFPDNFIVRRVASISHHTQ